MKLKKVGYLPRIVDAKIKESLELFGAVSIEGPKWCGKTWSALAHAESVNYILDPAGGYSNSERARLNPALALEGMYPHLIDEWQEVPGIWDAVRFNIDQEPGAGKYLLTGSFTPRRDSYAHSGTGRIAIVRMRPMSLFESGDSSAQISLKAIFDGEAITPFSADIELDRLIDVTVRGGWPETLKLPIELAGRVSSEYINTILKNELFNDSFSRRNSQKLRVLIRSLARNTATTVSMNALSLDVDGVARQAQDEEGIRLSRQTAADYIDDLKRIFVVEDINGWNPGIRSKTRIRMASKQIFADPSLAIAALGVTRDSLSHDLKTYGFLFENLCLRDLAVYAEANGGSLYHYRDNSGAEIDAIIETPDGSWGAFEIKLGEYQVEEAATKLKSICRKITANGAVTPACICVITGGGYGRRRSDGVYVVPVNAMKP